MSDDASDRSDFESLASELERRFHLGVGTPWPDPDFDALARRVFRFQLGHNRALRLLCERRGVRPDTFGHWEDVPLVPAMAFKHLDLSSVPGEPEAVFETSGTTEGSDRRGLHAVPRLALYRAALLEPFRAYLMPDRTKIRFVSLIPSAEDAPRSSLSRMVSIAAADLATETHWLVDATGSLDVEALRTVAEQSALTFEPVLMLGTALAFTHLIERIGDRALPAFASGSRIMETGGFKGARRAVSRTELYDAIAVATGVPTARIVNEYGMTELSSQLYEPVLTEGAAATGEHVPPPWLRVRALDPMTLSPLADGEEGVLAFFDLANLGTVAHVLTQDIGSVRDGRLRLRGRAPGAEPRGCSRAMDELMAAAKHGTVSR